MKRFLTLIILFSTAVHMFAADTVSYKVRQLENWAFYGTQYPTVQIVASNDRGVPKTLNLKCEIIDHSGRSLYELMQYGTVNPKDSLEMSFAFKALAPGFYNALFWSNGDIVKSVNVAYEPDKIVPADPVKNLGESIEPLGDYTRVANKVALDRRDHNPKFSLVRNKKLSGKVKNVYDFKMVSLDGETVKGLVAFPKGKKGIPAMISFVPAENIKENPLADFTASAQMAELVFYVSQRGEGEKYFRNILADVVLCVDFFNKRAEIDKSRIYAQGEDLGGVCAFLASTLDEGIAASFVATPDFREFVEKFTVESLAKNVSVPVLFGLGLQDKTSKLQDDLAIYNMTSSVKEYFIFPGTDSVERNQWKYIRDMFILRMGM